MAGRMASEQQDRHRSRPSLAQIKWHPFVGAGFGAYFIQIPG
jgi:hypothetical protein